MLNQVLKVSFGTCQVKAQAQVSTVSCINSLLRMLPKSVTFFWIFEFHNILQPIAGEVKIFVTFHREFSYESVCEIILKLGSHLLKVLTNIKWLTFLRQCKLIYTVVQKKTRQLRRTITATQFSRF